MNPTPQISCAEAVLNAVLTRFTSTVASTGAPNITTPLCGVCVGPYLGHVQGQKVPWLTVDLNEMNRRRVTVDGQVENRSALDLTLHDAAQGSEAGLLLGYRWAAWIESQLILPAERIGGPALNGTVDWIEPDGILLNVGGLGFSDFSVRVRFRISYSTALGSPFVPSS